MRFKTNFNLEVKICIMGQILRRWPSNGSPFLCRCLGQVEVFISEVRVRDSVCEVRVWFRHSNVKLK